MAVGGSEDRVVEHENRQFNKGKYEMWREKVCRYGDTCLIDVRASYEYHEQL